MAWDFSTEPEFEASWRGRGLRATRRSSPSRPSISTRRPGLGSSRPLQEEVKRQGLWAAHLPPELGGMGFGQVKLGLMHEILGRTPSARSSSATTPRTRATPSCWPWASRQRAARTSGSSGSSRCSTGPCAAASP